MADRFVMVADLRDPNDPQGRTYRQVNAEKVHHIPVGTLVEMENGARLFVVKQGRDCDQTPLYWLAPEMPEMVEGEDSPDAIRWERSKWIGGYGEESLWVVQPHQQRNETDA